MLAEVAHSCEDMLVQVWHHCSHLTLTFTPLLTLTLTLTITYS